LDTVFSLGGLEIIVATVFSMVILAFVYVTNNNNISSMDDFCTAALVGTVGQSPESGSDTARISIALGAVVAGMALPGGVPRRSFEPHSKQYLTTPTPIFGYGLRVV
jgi:hypothetical protein